ncbi:hypothetical protein NPIL_554341 [Nephila pilipes]|uniref:Uncharacterized protein n=1 Tax=Nephila pilipes TaxID=299642 RepID=A0A8X6K9L9_NEPPI|nr:hypothetical protein NPIL_554341 [Nephila pilipes]
MLNSTANVIPLSSCSLNVSPWAFMRNIRKKRQFSSVAGLYKGRKFLSTAVFRNPSAKHPSLVDAGRQADLCKEEFYFLGWRLSWDSEMLSMYFQRDLH